MRILLVVLACTLLVLELGRWAGGLVFALDDEATFALDIAIGVVALFLSICVLAFLPSTRGKA